MNYKLPYKCLLILKNFFPLEGVTLYTVPKRLNKKFSTSRVCQRSSYNIHEEILTVIKEFFSSTKFSSPFVSTFIRNLNVSRSNRTYIICK